MLTIHFPSLLDQKFAYIGPSSIAGYRIHGWISGKFSEILAAIAQAGMLTTPGYHRDFIVLFASNDQVDTKINYYGYYGVKHAIVRCLKLSKNCKFVSI